jgi:diguanylate cyclase (GGDEF)-like protein/PAS domain S-box-containing protein
MDTGMDRLLPRPDPASSDLVAAVANGLPDGVVLIDHAGRILWANVVAGEMFGRTPEEAVGDDSFDYIHPDDLQLAAVALQSLQDAPDGAQLELRTRDSQGCFRPVEIRGLWFGEGVLLVIRDLTDRRDVADRMRTEDELRRANSVLAATLDSIAEGILVLDLDGRIMSCNRRFAELWRVPISVLEREGSSVVMDELLDQLTDPAAFVEAVRELREARESARSDTVELLDGRMIELQSMPQRIAGRVVGHVWSFRDMTEQLRLQGDLAHQAFHDPLTGLANQSLFRDRLGVAAARLDRHDHRLAVIFIDLDDFKAVNDQLGHQEGDELLRGVGRRIHACLRPGDTAARLGGDEFAVLIEGLAHPEDATGVAERILAALQEPVVLGSTQVPVAASIGIAYGSPGDSVGDLLRNADLAMYTAKAMGKNCYRVFADEMHAAALERLDLAARLRGAVDRGELVVHYQPIVELSTGRIAAMEALVHWAHPERGLLGPTSFVPFAEEGGLIDGIGHHVMEVACAAAANWAERVEGDPPAVSVNISARALLDPQLPERVEALLHRTGLRAELLILEVTQDALVRDPDAARTGLERLCQLGVRLAVDDFGAGSFSLTHLRRFPFALLKIDGSFIDEDPVGGGWQLAGAVVHLARALGMAPVAEGVQTRAQAEALASFGCDLAQGFHLGRPLDRAAALRRISEDQRLRTG